MTPTAMQRKITDNLHDLSPAQRTCVIVVMLVMFPLVFVLNIIVLIATKLGITAPITLLAYYIPTSDEEVLGLIRKWCGRGSEISPPPYRMAEASLPLDYFSPTAPSEARQLRHARLFINGSLRRGSTDYAFSSAFATSYGLCYTPSLASSPSPTIPSGFSPLRRLLPSFHRRSTSDSDTAATSIISSLSAPSLLSSGGSYSCSSSSSSGSSVSPRRRHRRAFSQASAANEMGVARGSGRRPVNALPGEVFEQHFMAPFTSRRAPSRPLSPQMRSLGPALGPSGVAERLGLYEVAPKGRVGLVGGKNRLGSLRELGRKIRRRVVSRKRDPAEMSPSQPSAEQKSPHILALSSGSTV